MPDPRPTTRWTAALVRTATLAGACWLASFAGCAAEEDRLELRSADFAAEDAAVVLGPRANATPPTSNDAASAPSGPAGLGSAGSGVTLEPLPVVARPGRPTATSTALLAPNPDGREVLIDAKVGDVHGRPIFIDEFLEPLSGRLIAEAERRSPADWYAFAADLIAGELRQTVSDELLRAEALSRLSIEEKLGLRAFIGTLQDRLASANYGSASLAEAALLQDRGLTPTEYVAREEAAILVSRTIQREIRNRVQVSWRDIRQRYERDLDEYRPPLVAVLRVLQVRGPQADAAAEALAAGEAFETLASGPTNRFSRETGGELRLEFTPDGDLPRHFASDELNDMIASIRPGERVGPVLLGSSRVWVRLDRIEDRGVDLYDVQLDIRDEIYNTRATAYRNRLYQQLTLGVIEQSIQDIGVSLLNAAADRYGPEAGAGR
jgi:hypothetical protein